MMASAQRDRSRGSAPRRSVKGLVLIVDDDPDTRGQLDWCLHDHYNVLLAQNPDAARGLLRDL
jgi:hypothetical protein